jgi:hypothetical protein
MLPSEQSGQIVGKHIEETEERHVARLFRPKIYNHLIPYYDSGCVRKYVFTFAKLLSSK